MRTVVLTEEELKEIISGAVQEVIEKQMPIAIKKARAKEWLSPADVSREYGITRRSLQHLRDKKRIEFRKIGKRILFNRTEIENYLEEIKISNNPG